MAARAFITGLRGTVIAPDERAFLRDTSPFGLILFKRNIVDPSQLKELIEELRTLCGPEAAVLIDQEGGRVQRMAPPHWPVYPAGALYGELYRRDPVCGLRAAWLGARLMAADLAAVGITVDCLPVADVPVAGADQVIGDRAYGDTAQQVAAIATAVAAGLQAGGVLPVVKHLPGHGRATADSHNELPVVTADRATLEATDFAAFMPLAAAPFGMTSHVVFTALDPGLPATTSAIMIAQVIRGFIGFSGALMSDDVSMGALSGPIAERVKQSLAAGCDLVLHCNGKLAEMQEVAVNCAELDGVALQRTARALASRRAPEVIDLDAARAEFAQLVSGRAGAVTG
ncbi:MAG TPA: beta-N-acetylhexosaminidase [Xanthobacteraceae bacterium]|nr:beta-N-acetylhexosaminidase [Xanthobacteraceae bacterium]